ncbi:MAG: hypothetical protein COA88_15115 [Kordia sp.]|nr:MAG: hypothetical protein COA88_15115 [Kordia sp.]
MSQRELYAIVISKSDKGNKGRIVVVISGTNADVVIEVLNKVHKEKHDAVTEITLDMADSARKSIVNAVQVTDRFHVQKIALEALQDICIKHRLQAVDDENTAIYRMLKKRKNNVSNNAIF